MNRIMGRARIMIVLILVLSTGFGLFVADYLTNCRDWVMFPGSPHLYNAGNLGCGIVTDRDGALLLDMTGGRDYSKNAALRTSVVHWLGDRHGHVSAPAVSHYASQMMGYDPINGIYAYGGGNGKATMTLYAPAQMAALEAMQEKKGTVAVYNYRTGEILCAVSTPSFDPDNVPDLSEGEAGSFDGLYVNRFLQSAYTPGSIFKVLTLAAALEAIPDIEQQQFECTGLVEYGVDKVTCPEIHGVMDLKTAFACSCNCAFASIAGQLGGETLQRYAQQFRATESVSFDGITTAAGNLEAEGKADVLVAWSAIGQHKDLVNPCAYLSFVGAIANEGILLTPRVVSTVSSAKEVTYEAQQTAGTRIMSGKTARTLQEYMRFTVSFRYGEEHFEGLTLSGKTGTAEVGTEKEPNGTFTGFLSDPSCPLAFIAVIEESDVGGWECFPVVTAALKACMESFG